MDTFSVSCLKSPGISILLNFRRGFPLSLSAVLVHGLFLFLLIDTIFVIISSISSLLNQRTGVPPPFTKHISAWSELPSLVAALSTVKISNAGSPKDTYLVFDELFGYHVPAKYRDSTRAIIITVNHTYDMTLDLHVLWSGTDFVSRTN